MIDERKREIAHECDDCKFFQFCRGGCTYDGLISSGSFYGKTSYCKSRQKIFDYIYNDIKKRCYN